MQQGITAGNLRVQLFTDGIVRVECARGGQFFDGASLFIPERKQLALRTDADVVSDKEGTAVRWEDYELVLPAPQASLDGVCLKRGGRTIYLFGGEKNSGELPPLGRAPAAFPVADTPRIRLPEGGYSAARKGEYVVEENVQDVYLLLCEGDDKRLRALYVTLTGRSALVRLSTLGAWNSKYFRYDEASAKQVILDYEAYGIPLDNMVIDTDWRAASDRGIGYDIDTKLFPDMGAFFAFAHEHGVNIMFNDHPEPVEGAQSVFSPEEIAFREEKLQAIMALGLDTWWYDRNWSTALKSPTKGVRQETLGAYLFSDITGHFYRRAAGNDTVFRRPDIMANINEVTNGTYVGIRDSASHRYSIQWTGDIGSDAAALAQEVDTLLRVSENCIPYVNADCGGHTGDPDREMYLRWIGFGTFSPVLRPHCTNNVLRFREPWLYDEETLRIARDYFRLRYRLLPVLYTAAHESYACGAPICRRLGWNYPQDERALACRTQFMLGKDLLIAPAFGTVPAPVPASCYVSDVCAAYYAGSRQEGEVLARTREKTLALNLDNVAPCDGVPVHDFSAHFETDLYFAEDVKLFLRLDDGAAVYLDGVCVLTDPGPHSAKMLPLGLVTGARTHRLVIDYVQGGGEACCELYAMPAAERGIRVYLPAGRWLDAFTGTMLAGGSHEKTPAFGETPLFVRAGALIPLAYDAKNTREQRWDRLVFDFYPARDASDEGVLYEDDGETTAYETGAFRTTAYGAHYENGRYVVHLDRAEGTFAGSRACARREVTVRFHCLGERVRRVLLDGEELPVCTVPADASAFPLSAEGGARDGAIVEVTFSAQADRAQSLQFEIDA